MNPYIPEYESIFNEDINEDGLIGFNEDLLEKVSTDTFGTELYRADKYLFIKGNDFLRISNKDGYSLKSTLMNPLIIHPQMLDMQWK